MFDLAGRTALVTGAGSGIGAAVARALDASGAARLILVDRDGDAMRGPDLACEFVPLTGDVADPSFWNGPFAEAAAAHGPIDHAVLNAGISSGGPIAELDFAEWRRVLSTNLDGTFLSLQATLRAIRDDGAIVLTASISGAKAEPGTAAYGASKAGVMQLARVAAKEAAPRGVRVNAIAPGGVDTPIWDDTPFFRDLVAEHGGDRGAAMDALARMATPLGRYASADEIAQQIAFLLSDAAATITGAVLVSDGGYSL
ncbi:SDR family oxidoreductase [Erythrobacter sp. LQ02-29]|uniref:SDR family NAD(P)-dependent oxidoreductase n=1 Tax=Erythrobacter sp. LQ02-29 TaxID=2920384 RepID=UPI001F4DB014|nr:SDR family NAD(P)-dependent oxidoreductase [Erythrobacter sp. LQ02-29]MCP9222328.1 SDR family oxidoreductase [Erythrobacter sp. LQ02-29]